MNLLESLRDFFLEQGAGRQYWIAYSGGLDSEVLLSACAKLREELSLNIQAIHINHQLSPNANKWAASCEQACLKLAVPFHIESVDVVLNAGDSLEEVARLQRYAALAGYVGYNDILLTGHHQDDQAETVLIQLLRGAGPKGLSGMPKIKSFAKGYKARPLLPFSKKELLAYAKDHQLQWVDDESNGNTQLTRNYLRHAILPMLNDRWPGVATAISRSAQHCAETQMLANIHVAGLYKTVVGSKTGLISVSKLLQLSEVEQRFVLRYWISMHDIVVPDFKKIINIQRTVLAARQDAKPHVEWGDMVIRRFRDDLYLLPSMVREPPKQTFSWDLRSTITLSTLGVLSSSPAKGQGLSCKLSAVTVSFRDHVNKEVNARKLKKLYQECAIPPWERAVIPLLFAGDKLVAIVGYYIDKRYAVSADEDGFDVRLIA